MYKTICLIFAMYAEAQPLINELMLTEDLSYADGLPMRSWVGKYGGSQIIVVINGRDKNTQLDFIGTQSATLNTHLAIVHYQPDLIISAGTAGAFSGKGASVGEVYLSYPHVIFHDRRIEIPGWKEVGWEHFSSKCTLKTIYKIGCTHLSVLKYEKAGYFPLFHRNEHLLSSLS